MTTETTTFEIKTHEHEFTELYVNLRRELEQVKGIPEEFRSYQTDEDLKNLQNYRETANTFHVTDHWYAFENGELIGYAHLWPTYTDGEEKAEETAATDIPGVKGDNHEVFKALKKAIVERAKHLGVTTLSISANEREKLKIEEITLNGFSKADLQQVNAKIDVNTSDFQVFDNVQVFEYDEERHLDDVVGAYETIDINREFVENQSKNLRAMGERIISWNVSYEDEKLTGHSMVIRYTDEGTTGQLLTVTRGVDISDDAYNRAVNTLYHQNLQKAKNKGLEMLDVFLPVNRLHQRDFFESLGMKFEESYNYNQHLDQF